jgi:hypothetical protein
MTRRPRYAGPEPSLDNAGQARTRRGPIVGGKHPADRRRDHLLLASVHVPLHVAEEAHGAALPGAAEDLGDRPLQAFVGVGDAERDAAQAAGHEIAQELAPEGL